MRRELVILNYTNITRFADDFPPALWGVITGACACLDAHGYWTVGLKWTD
jgi:hypothetical protein